MDAGEESWENAQRLIKPLGHLPSNFSSAVRTMLSNYEKGTPLNGGAEHHLYRILRNNTVKAIYYHCAKAYRPSVLSVDKQLNPRHFISSFTPIEHAIILSYCVLFRAFVKRCNKDEWEYIQSPLYETLEAGARIGEAIPEVGLAFGLLSRGIRYLSFASFLLDDPKAFKEYRRYLRAKDLPFDMRREEKVWRCTNVQVAALLLERMGFNRSIGLQFMVAAEKSDHVAPDDLYGKKFRTAEALLDHYMENGSIPKAVPEWTGTTLNMSSDQMIALERALNDALTAKERIEWLSKGSSNINPKSTPEFFMTRDARSEAATKGEEERTPATAEKTSP